MLRRTWDARGMTEPSVFLTTDRLVLRRFTLDDAEPELGGVGSTQS